MWPHTSLWQKSIDLWIERLVERATMNDMQRSGTSASSIQRSIALSSIPHDVCYKREPSHFFRSSLLASVGRSVPPSSLSSRLLLFDSFLFDDRFLPDRHRCQEETKMHLSDLLDENFSSANVIGAKHRTSTIGDIFSTNSYVGFYFYHDNIMNNSTSTNRIVVFQSSESKSSSSRILMDQAKILMENVNGIRESSDDNNDNKKMIKSSTMENNSNGGGLAIIFVSIDGEGENSDRTLDDDGHDGLWNLSTKEQRAKVLLLRTYRIRSSPTFVIVDARSKRTVSTDGRRALQADPQGRRFPWHLPEAEDVFRGQLIKKTVNDNQTELIDVADTNGSIKCLLFAAHWCPPCRSFVKQLKQAYGDMKESSQSPTQVQFEIVFCSMDRCEDSFRQFYADMPWLAFPYNDPRCVAAARLYYVQEIPTLLVLDADNQLVTRHGKCELAMDPIGKEFPWYPKLIMEMNSHTATRMREDISFLLFTEGTSEDLVFAHTSLLPIAEEFCVRSGSSDEQDMVFFYCGDDPICDQLWENLSLGDASLPLVCIVDPFTDNLYVCDDPNVSEVIIRRFIEKFFTGDLEPTRRLASLSPDGNRNFSSPAAMMISSTTAAAGNSNAIANMAATISKTHAGGEREIESSTSASAKRLCVTTVAGGNEAANNGQRYCCL